VTVYTACGGGLEADKCQVVVTWTNTLLSRLDCHDYISVCCCIFSVS